LHSWTDDEALTFYSGEAAYERDLDVAGQFLEPGLHAYLDFGSGTAVEQPQTGYPHGRAWLESPVREAAQVFVNGEAAGAVWKPPYELEVSRLLHSGKNHIRILVGNLAVNTLAGHSLPDHRLLNDRYGERFVPQDMENLRLLPSGLLGAVRLVTRGDQ
jgi:hypothetical protein